MSIKNTTKPEIQEKPEPVKVPAPLVLKLEKEWPYRLIGNLIILIVIGMIAAIILTLKNDLVNKRINETKEEFYVWAGEQGLTLDDVVVTGRQRTTKQELNSALGVKRGDNMLKIDVYAIKQKIEQLPWVKAAQVKRSFFPNVINIELTEKEVGAIWQLNEKFYPIDEDGVVINADFRSSEPILLIVGAGAPEHLKELLDVIKDSGKKYLQRIKVANFIAKRRWNLIFDDIVNGITVKLPEDNVGEAWKKLLKLNETKGILKRKLTIIDLRLPDKVVVKLRKTQGQPPVELIDAVERNT